MLMFSTISINAEKYQNIALVLEAKGKWPYCTQAKIQSILSKHSKTSTFNSDDNSAPPMQCNAFY